MACVVGDKCGSPSKEFTLSREFTLGLEPLSEGESGEKVPEFDSRAQAPGPATGHFDVSSPTTPSSGASPTATALRGSGIWTDGILHSRREEPVSRDPIDLEALQEADQVRQAEATHRANLGGKFKVGDKVVVTFSDKAFPDGRALPSTGCSSEEKMRITYLNVTGEVISIRQDQNGEQVYTVRFDDQRANYRTTDGFSLGSTRIMDQRSAGDMVLTALAQRYARFTSDQTREFRNSNRMCLKD